MMTYRIVETQTNDVIVAMNKTRLLKLIGWIEAHRRPGADEPSWLRYCMQDLDTAREGLDLDAKVSCVACGRLHDINGPGAYYDPDAGWFCNDRELCDEGRAAVAALAADLAQEAQS